MERAKESGEAISDVWPLPNGVTSVLPVIWELRLSSHKPTSRYQRSIKCLPNQTIGIALKKS